MAMKEELIFLEDIENGDYPNVTKALKAHIQGKFSLANTTDQIARFKAGGYSEAYILGWLQGVNAVSQYLDVIDEQSKGRP